MGDKRVETLGNKILFLSVLVTFSTLPPPPPPPLNVIDFSISSAAQTTALAQLTLNWGAGDIRRLTLDANKIEQILNQKTSFPKSVSTTFVSHCLEAIYANCGDFLHISMQIVVISFIYPSSTRR